MIWNIVSLRSSLQSMLGQKPTAKSTEPDREQVERVRRAMVGSLEQAGPDGFEHVVRRLEQAKDIAALWFLRAALMAALSAIDDETAARRAMARITPLFNGLLPASLNSRPSPLGG